MSSLDDLADAASSANPAKRPRGRPRGGGNKLNHFSRTRLNAARRAASQASRARRAELDVSSPSPPRMLPLRTVRSLALASQALVAPTLASILASLPPPQLWSDGGPSAIVGVKPASGPLATWISPPSEELPAAPVSRARSQGAVKRPRWQVDASAAAASCHAPGSPTALQQHASLALIADARARMQAAAAQRVIRQRVAAAARQRRYHASKAARKRTSQVVGKCSPQDH